MSNQPYRFSGGNPAGSLAQSIGGFIAGGLKQRSGVHEKMMEHEMRIRENAIATVVKSEARKAEIKAQGKQARKFEKAKANAGAKAAVKSATGMAEAAKTLGRSAAPGSKVGLTPTKVDYTTKPKAASKPAAPAETPAPVSTPRAKTNIARPSMRGGTY